MSGLDSGRGGREARGGRAARGGCAAGGGRTTARGGRAVGGGCAASRTAGRAVRGGRAARPRALGESYVANCNIDIGAPPAVDKCIPDAFKACKTGWKEMQVPKFDIVSLEEYENKYACGSLADSYLHCEKHCLRSW